MKEKFFYIRIHSDTFEISATRINGIQSERQILMPQIPTARVSGLAEK